MEHLDQRMPTSASNEENHIIIRSESKDQQKRKQKQDHNDSIPHHSTPQQSSAGQGAVTREEKERRRRSADPSMQGENSTSAISRQHAIEERERQKKADKRRSLAEAPISASPLTSSPLRNSAGPGVSVKKRAQVLSAVDRWFTKCMHLWTPVPIMDHLIKEKPGLVTRQVFERILMWQILA